ncbi:MAG: epimerase, partial [Thaumarchaeota archaeon]|nr:epimerase [Nitrososphaerota archaeon]
VVNHRLLLCCLFSLAFIGTTYYYLDDRKQVYEIQWIVMSIAWYSAIGFSIAKVLSKSRIGYLVAGITSWITLAFWLLDNYYIVFHVTIIATRPDNIMVIRNFIGVAVASLGILSSHNAFHKSKCVQNKAEPT